MRNANWKDTLLRPDIIIIEGTDGTGKSTLARELQQVGYAYVHASAPQESNWYDEYVGPLVGAVQSCTPVVCDRWHIGELVWPQIFKRQSLFATDSEFRTCHDAIVNMGALVIILTREGDDVKAELQSRGEDDANIVQSLMALDLFARFGQFGLDNVVVCSLPTARRLLGLQ